MVFLSAVGNSVLRAASLSSGEVPTNFPSSPLFTVGTAIFPDLSKGFPVLVFARGFLLMPFYP